MIDTIEIRSGSKSLTLYREAFLEVWNMAGGDSRRHLDERDTLLFAERLRNGLNQCETPHDAAEDVLALIQADGSNLVIAAEPVKELREFSQAKPVELKRTEEGEAYLSTRDTMNVLHVSSHRMTEFRKSGKLVAHRGPNCQVSYLKSEVEKLKQERALLA